jgi:hypothetical protein
MSTCFCAFLSIEAFFGKHQNLNFWWYFKVPQANCPWADFATLVVAENMPKVRLKSLKPSNSSTMDPKATWRSSLESYHPYLLTQKV